MAFAEDILPTLDIVVGALPDGGEHRQGQQTMAVAVADTIAGDNHAVIAAGTGTGKSLAYLVPVALFGKPTIIATATKALQDQLAKKDLPFLCDHWEDPPIVALLKGRANYLCLQRLDELDHEATLDLGLKGGPISSTTIDELKVFATTSSTGDRAELDNISDRDWDLVSVGSDECLGAERCPKGEVCLSEKARALAAEADIVVVNHTLYALAVEMPKLLPEHDVVVLDEAHQFGDIVAEAMGRKISPALVRTASRTAASAGIEAKAVIAAEKAAADLHNSLKPFIGLRLLDGPDEVVGAALDNTRATVDGLLTALRTVTDAASFDAASSDTASSDARAKVIRARQSLTSLVDDIDAVRWPTDEEVIWVSGPEKHPMLRSTRLDIADLLAEKLWDKRSAILTSATLPTGATSRLGLPDTTAFLDVGSPFDFAANSLLYCPANFPAPMEEGFRAAQHAEIESLIMAAGGRTLALFTSHAALREAAAKLSGRLPGPLLMQGDGSKNALMRRFVEEEETSLFATATFWQGIDAPGSTCQLVIICRLPFPRPNDPVIEARSERAGGGFIGFQAISVPHAATRLAQGTGRLIRTATDRGVVAVLDPRLATHSYRHDLLSALPPMPRTRERAVAERFLRELRDQ